MKRFRKLLYLFICLTVFLTAAGKADYAEAAAPGGTFEVSYISSSRTAVGIDVSIGGPAEVGLWDAYGNAVQTKQCSSYAAFTGLKKNSLYFYRVRGLTYNVALRTYVASTDWSAPKAFVTANYKLSLVSSKGRTVKFKFPKIAGVKSYTLYMSTKGLDKGFKKVKSIKPGKTYKISKFKGKTFTYYKRYYYKIVPKLKAGGTAAAYSDGFYIYRTYKK